MDAKNSLSKIFGDKWEKLPDDSKEIVIKKFSELLNEPTEKINEVNKELEELKEKENGIQFLILGVLLGVSGNLVASLLDRSFVKYGFVYDVFVGAVFFLSIWYINRLFWNRVEKIMKKNTAAHRIAEIIAMVVSKK